MGNLLRVQPIAKLRVGMPYEIDNRNEPAARNMALDAVGPEHQFGKEARMVVHHACQRKRPIPHAASLLPPGRSLGRHSPRAGGGAERAPIVVISLRFAYVKFVYVGSPSLSYSKTDTPTCDFECRCPRTALDGEDRRSWGGFRQTRHHRRFPPKPASVACPARQSRGEDRGRISRRGRSP